MLRDGKFFGFPYSLELVYYKIYYSPFAPLPFNMYTVYTASICSKLLSCLFYPTKYKVDKLVRAGARALIGGGGGGSVY